MMSAIPAPSSEREQRLDDVIAAYLEALEAGEPLARSDLEEAHPDLADELALFFANQDHVARLTAPLRDGTTGEISYRQPFSTPQFQRSGRRRHRAVFVARRHAGGRRCRRP